MRKLILLSTIQFSWFAEGAVVSRVIMFRETLDMEVFNNSGGSTLQHNIDLDGNGVVDFFTTNAGSESTIVPTGNNRILSIPATGLDLGRRIVALEPASNILSSPHPPFIWSGLADRVNEFDSGGANIFVCSGRIQPGLPSICNSEIPFDETRYVGLELEIDGETHLGWVGINSFLTPNNESFLVSWAYETSPNTSITTIPEVSHFLLSVMGMAFLLRRRR